MKISVCLAAYNGSQFIRNQIESILVQLGEYDELLIGDDDSSDDTVPIILSFNDPRIRLYESKHNLGHVKNFEKLISESSGDLIFLSDQDDYWEPNKVTEVKKIMQTYPSITMVNHALALMDEHGVVYDYYQKKTRSEFYHKGALIVGQIIKSEIYGCALAFRGSLKQYILPFARNAYAHDHWLVLVNGLVGKTYYIATPLVRYRQHANNLTPKRGLSLVKKITIRLIQISHLIFIIYRKFKIIQYKNQGT
jgi:glycosyltransferase involved in cell wall biosynthesis